MNINNSYIGETRYVLSPDSKVLADLECVTGFFVEEIYMSKNLKSPAITAGNYTFYLRRDGIDHPVTRNFSSFYEFCAYAYKTFDIDELPHLVELPGGVPVRFEPTIIHYYFAKGRITEDECIMMLMELMLQEERVVA